MDVKAAFLNGHLDQEKEKMYLEIPEGFERFYPTNVYLLLLKALHGTKQAAMVFWKELLKCMRDMKYQRSGADPCMYFRWFDKGLVVWLSWIYDCMVWGPEELAKVSKECW